jgi:Fe-Mn family superoxide dismutase
MKRRDFIGTIGMGAVATTLSTSLHGAENNVEDLAGNLSTDPKIFQDLPYSYNALEPHIDAMTMEIHYDRHHRGYFNKYLAAVKGKDFENMPLEKVFQSTSKYGDGVRNNGGGFYNHTLFWNNMTGEKTKPSAELAKAIVSTFGSLDSFKAEFGNSAKTRFGSGWAWLIIDKSGKLVITSTANQDNPLMDTSEIRGIPILALDVWEHAYYLKYQNKRPDYVDAFWNVVNWNEVSRRYAEAIK